MANDNDVEKVKVIDDPIKSNIKVTPTTGSEAPQGAAPKQGEGGQTGGEERVVNQDGKEYYEVTLPDGSKTLKERGFWDRVRDGMERAPEGSGLEKATKKIRVKLNRFGLLIAEAEQFVYEKYKLNQLMTPEEIHNEKVEINEDMDLLIDTRVKVLSHYGDIINIVIDMLAHVVTRAFRFYQRKNGKTPDGSPERPFTDDSNNDVWEQQAKQMGITVDELKRLSGAEHG